MVEQKIGLCGNAAIGQRELFRAAASAGRDSIEIQALRRKSAIPRSKRFRSAACF
jgi:hypothetical protein